MHFISRERIHVDRIATAWAIRRFVDPGATFEFVPRTWDVSGVGAIPFDVRGAELGHRSGRCTLDALIDKYEIADEAIRRMARIVRAADLPHDDPTPVIAPGVLAIFDGIRDGCETDEERLAKGFVVCDALYEYCRRTKEAASEL
ncbi:MAG TPA: chromate resistance protein ChrB domain-containing protein [Candidatus Dormibacteraeota bacterium]|nr:chromate resistance protein ChrB domain-containing protein [Candidatus Dormibacteraeota bacterium]